MAKKEIWSRKAQSQRKEILAYWIKRNKSKEYSLKLNLLFKEAIKIISIFPEIGLIIIEFLKKWKENN